MSQVDPSGAAIDADLSGRSLGNYQLLRRLGRGAMAEVYLAEQVSLRRQVAFKVLRSNLATDTSYVQRFHREAQAAASLVHANIVQIYEVGCVEGVHFIAQEYVQGSNLGEHLVRRGSPSLKQSLVILLQAAAALQKANAQGIVHRDVKPENILLTESLHVKVADFGLARVAGDENATTLTQAGFTMGTPLYMSPEQIEGKSLDGRSDIYNLGVTAYHMLCGQPPFRGDTPLSVAIQHLRELPPRLENVRSDLSPAICRIVHKMLQKNPQDRYVDARELTKDLRAFAAVELSEHELEDYFSGEDSLALSNTVSRQAATQRLAALMKSTSKTSPFKYQWLVWGLAASVAFTAGLLLALQRHKPLISNGPPPVTVVEKKATAEAQWVYALMIDTEDAWKSVSAFHPEASLYGMRAKEQLARLYLQEDEYQKALAIFNEFAEQPSVEVRFRAFGLAGQAVVYTIQKKYAQSAEKLAELWPHREELDPQMKNLMAYVLRKNKEKLAGKSTESWTEFLETPAGERGG
jgi:serine/threonine-protein kinase